MYAQISWISFRFSAPAVISRELYESAKLDSPESRASIDRQVPGQIMSGNARKQLGGALLFSSLGAVLLTVASFLGVASKYHDVLGLVGAILVISGLLTTGSFIKCVIDRRMHWLAVCEAARRSPSYPEFLVVANERRLLGNQSPRERRQLSFSRTSAVIAGIAGCIIFLVAFNAPPVDNHVGMGARAFLASFCAFVIALPTYLVANFYSNKY